MAQKRKERTSSEPKEWQDGQEKAREARENVAEQISALIVERELTGAEGLFARRLRQIADAQRQGDRVALRAAIMETAVSAGHWAAAIDLQQSIRPAA